MSLKEKAKTGADIRYELEIATVTQWQFLSKVRWVRLEDAEQEMEKQKSEIVGENEDILIQMWLDEIDASRKEGLELKQKLQELLKDFPREDSYTDEDGDFHYVDYAGDCEVWLKRFEELLKEEKETK